MKLRRQNIERHGVEHALQRKDVRQKSLNTLLKRYGVSNPLQHEPFKLQTQTTLLAKHGVTNAFHIPENVKRYDRELMMQKSIATMKRNKTFHSSRAEEKLNTLLCQQFQHVERQVRIPNTRWNIDFYVRDIDTYIQVDGVYWHGLNRPLEEIKASTKPRDAKIARAWLSDRAQEQWFAEHGMRLVRITDKQVNQLNDVQFLLDASQELLVAAR